jgi:hypothetical protein
MPKSILILPPINKTTEIMASNIYLSTLSRAIAERGYYVFPVAVVDAMMKDNGFSIPDEMAQIPLKKITEVINPDAVLYLTILQWGTKYQLVETICVVQIRGRLVDTKSGVILWKGEHKVVYDFNNEKNNSKNITEAMVEAIVTKIGSSFADPTVRLARSLNKKMFYDSRKGLLFGHRHKDYINNYKLLMNQ